MPYCVNAAIYAAMQVLCVSNGLGYVEAKLKQYLGWWEGVQVWGSRDERRILLTLLERRRMWWLCVQRGWGEGGDGGGCICEEGGRGGVEAWRGWSRALGEWAARDATAGLREELVFRRRPPGALASPVKCRLVT